MLIEKKYEMISNQISDQTNSNFKSADDSMLAEKDINYYRKKLEEGYNESKPFSFAHVEIMKYVKCYLINTGYKTFNSDYVYCKNCDSDEKNPICLQCAEVCHVGHKITPTMNMNAICACGLNCHRIQNNVDSVIDYKCVFVEWYDTSNLSFYFKGINDNNQANILPNDSSNIYCIFCANFCIDLNNCEKITLKDSLSKKKTNNSQNSSTIKKNNFKCACTHEIHKDRISVLKKFNEFANFKNLDFGNLIETQVINMLFLSPQTYKYIFGSFRKSIIDFKEEIKKYNTISQSFITSSLIFAAQNLSSFRSITKDFTYFSNEITYLIDSDFIFTLLTKKFDTKNIPICFFISQIVQIYYSFIFKRCFCNSPNIMINDLLNLNPLFRLLLIRNIHSNYLIHNMLINNFSTKLLTPSQLYEILSFIEQIYSDNIYVMNIINGIYKMILVYAKYNLIPDDILISLCALSEEFIRRFSCLKRAEIDAKTFKNICEIQIEVISNMSQIILYTAIFINDVQIEHFLYENLKKLNNINNNDNVNSESSISNSIEESDIAFFHCSIKTRTTWYELSRLISKINISIINFYRINLHFKETKPMKMIFDCSQFILSLFLETSEDIYINGLKQSLCSNTCLLIKYSSKNVFIENDLFVKSCIFDNQDDSELNNQKSILAKSSELENKFKQSAKSDIIDDIKVNIKTNKIFLYSSKELEFLKFLTFEVQKLEQLIEEFFVFKYTTLDIQKTFLSSILLVMTYLGKENFKQPSVLDIENKKVDILTVIEKYNRLDNIIEKNVMSAVENLELNFDNLKNAILNKTFYIFTLFKSLKIIIATHRNKNKFELKQKEPNLDKGFIEKLVLFMYIYSEENVENILVTISSYFTDIILLLPKSYFEQFLQYYIYIFTYLHNIDYKPGNLDSFMNFLECILLNVKSKDTNLIIDIINLLNIIKEFSTTVSKINPILKSLLKQLYKCHSVFKNFKEFIIKNNTFKDYYCESELSYESKGKINKEYSIDDNNERIDKNEIEKRLKTHNYKIDDKNKGIEMRFEKGQTLRIGLQKKKTIMLNKDDKIKVFKDEIIDKNDVSDNENVDNNEKGKEDDSLLLIDNNIKESSNKKKKTDKNISKKESKDEDKKSKSKSKEKDSKKDSKKESKKDLKTKTPKFGDKTGDKFKVNSDILDNLDNNDKVTFVSNSTDNIADSYIFINFLKIVNKVYDSDQTSSETKFLLSIFNQDEIISVLKNINISLIFRVELLSYFRLAYVDLISAMEKSNEYRTLLVNEITDEDDELNTGERTELYTFLKNLMSINNNLANFKSEILIIKREMYMFNDILISSQSYDTESIIAYFEEGIIRPLNIFVNKFISIIYLLNGYALIDLYELVINFLKLKIFLLTNKQIFTLSMNSSEIEDINDLNENIFKKTKDDSIIKSMFKFEKSQLDEAKKDLETMTKQNFEVFNYKLVFSIYEKHSSNFISKPEVFSMLNHFSRNFSVENNVTNSLIENQHRLSYSKKLILNLIIKYEMEKQSLSQSTFITILDDMNLLYRTSYRYMFLKTLFFLSNEESFKGKFSKMAFWDIFRLLHHDTNKTQVEIFKLYKQNPSIINFEYIEWYFMKNLISLIFSQFNPYKSIDKDNYFQALIVIKLLKYLCEEHNQVFQTILFSMVNLEILVKTESDEMDNSDVEILEKTSHINIFNYMLCVLGKIISLTDWLKAKYNSNDNDVGYYYDLYFCIVELLIEIVQGTTKENLDGLLHLKNNNPKEENTDYMMITANYDISIKNAKIKVDTLNDSSYLIKCLRQMKDLLFYNEANSMIIYKARLDVINFVMAFYEEPNTPIELINNISNVFPINKVLDTITIVMKKLYIKLNKDKIIKDKNLNEDDIDLNLLIHTEYNDLVFNSEIGYYFENLFKSNLSLRDDNPEFELCNKLYQFLFLLHHEYQYEEASNIFKIIESYKQKEESFLNKSFKKKEKNDIENKPVIENKFSLNLEFIDNINSFTGITSSNKNAKSKEIIIDQQFYETFYTILFFEKITNSVVVNKDGKDSRIVYTKNPLLDFLSDNTKKEFFENVNRENRYTKLHELNISIKNFYEEVIYFGIIKKGNPLYKIVNDFDFLSYEKYLFVIPVMMNIFMISSLINISAYTQMSTGLNNLIPRIATPLVSYDNDVIETINFILFILLITLNGLGLILWSIIKFPIYYNLQELEEYNNNLKKIKNKDDEKEYKAHLKSFIMVMRLSFNTLLSKSEVHGLIYNIIIALLARIRYPDFIWINSLLLLYIINLNHSMNNIRRAFVSKAKMILNAILFNIIIFAIFSNIGYFWLKQFYMYKINVSGYEVNENICGTLINCFTTIMRYGFNMEGGIGEFITKTYYEPGNTIFAAIFFHNLSFFWISKVFILYISLSLIADRYAELREESYKLAIDINDICYICGASREQKEKANINFNYHTSVEHNIWTYTEYLVSLNFLDAQETNALNSYVIDMLNQNSTTWYPNHNEEI